MDLAKLLDKHVVAPPNMNNQVVIPMQQPARVYAPPVELKPPPVILLRPIQSPPIEETEELTFSKNSDSQWVNQREPQSESAIHKRQLTLSMEVHAHHLYNQCENVFNKTIITTLKMLRSEKREKRQVGSSLTG